MSPEPKETDARLDSLASLTLTQLSTQIELLWRLNPVLREALALEETFWVTNVLLEPTGTMIHVLQETPHAHAILVMLIITVHTGILAQSNSTRTLVQMHTTVVTQMLT